MRIRELDLAECREILGRSDLGHLACSHNGQPYVVPIHFSFDAYRNVIYAFSKVGQKISWMRENPKVCLEVDDIVDKNHWTTLLVFGLYEELTDSPDDVSARRTAFQLFQRRPEWWFPAAGKTGADERHAVVVYRIKVGRLTGRRALRPDLDPEG